MLRRAQGVKLSFNTSNTHTAVECVCMVDGHCVGPTAARQNWYQQKTLCCDSKILLHSPAVTSVSASASASSSQTEPMFRIIMTVDEETENIIQWIRADQHENTTEVVHTSLYVKRRVNFLFLSWQPFTFTVNRVGRFCHKNCLCVRWKNVIQSWTDDDRMEICEWTSPFRNTLLQQCVLDENSLTKYSIDSHSSHPETHLLHISLYTCVMLESDFLNLSWFHVLHTDPLLLHNSFYWRRRAELNVW